MSAKQGLGAVITSRNEHQNGLSNYKGCMSFGMKLRRTKYGLFVSLTMTFHRRDDRP